MDLLGAIGIGIVWGWLVAKICGRPSLRLRSIAAWAVALIAPVLIVFWLAGVKAVFVLGIAAALGAALRAAWRNGLSMRFAKP